MADAPLAIVVPVLNEAGSLPEFLDQLQAWRQAGCELVLVDGGSTDGSGSLAESRVDQLLRSKPGRARQMNTGAAATGAAHLLFLHCDTRLAISPQTLLSALADKPGWGFFRVRLSGRDWRLRVIESAMNLRSSLTRVATGDQCLFVDRRLWAELGGFADIPLMEDIELCKRLRRCAPPAVLSPPVTTSSRRWEERGVVATVLHMWYLRLAFWLGVAPEKLVRSYYG